MRTLSLDIETFSDVDIRKTNVYRYAESPNFEVLLLGYAFDDDDVQVIDLTRQALPDDIREALTSDDVEKTAYNAQFERVCLSKLLGLKQLLPPRQWTCTMVHAATCGLPRTLAEVGEALGLPEDKQKLKTGKALIDYFCKPCKPTRSNGGRTRNLPEHALDKWQMFIDYNRRDVETEREIRRKLSAYPVPMDEREAYVLDQGINDRGVRVDIRLARAAMQMSEEHSRELADEAGQLTGLSNVNSVSQLKNWLGHDGSLDKKAIARLRDSKALSGDADRVLEIRQEMGKTSVSKYDAMLRGVSADGRVRGLFAFYGANRTGRWAGRQVQVQNLPQNHLPDLAEARQIVKEGDRDALQALFGNVPATLSELIRTAFVPDPGKLFCVADFSAIEARIVAWLAGEKWRQEVFRTGGDIYCASASQMFHVPVEKHGVNGHLRQKGKIAELALGYGGGVGALKAMGALDMGLQEEELQGLVTAWRKSNPRVTDLWWRIDEAAHDTVLYQTKAWRNDLPYGLSMNYEDGMLQVRLPSGRVLRYWRPRLEANAHGGESITYGGMDAGKWGRVETYGPKIFENIVQGTARDCLRDAMLRVAELYPDIVMHVHDEMIVEVDSEHAHEALTFMQHCMGKPLPWAPGLLLRGDGYTCEFYKKD